MYLHSYQKQTNGPCCQLPWGPSPLATQNGCRWSGLWLFQSKRAPTAALMVLVFVVNVGCNIQIYSLKCTCVFLPLCFLFVIVTLMGWCKKDIPPVLTHWSYVFLALTHQYNLGPFRFVWSSYPILLKIASPWSVPVRWCWRIYWNSVVSWPPQNTTQHGQYAWYLLCFSRFCFVVVLLQFSVYSRG